MTPLKVTKDNQLHHDCENSYCNFITMKKLPQ